MELVEWPSVLALGRHGVVEQATFVVAAGLGLAFAATLASLMPASAGN